MKRTLSLALALLLCLSLLPAAALADGDPAEAPAEYAEAAEAEAPAEPYDPAPAEETAEESPSQESPSQAEAPAEEAPPQETAPAEAAEPGDPGEPDGEPEEACGPAAAEFFDTPDAALALWLDGASMSEIDVRARLEEVLAEHPAGSSWNTSFNGGIQCYGFARLVVHEVFGYASGYYRSWTYSSAGTGMYTVGRVETCTEESVKELLSRAMPGDVLQFDAGPNGHQHSMIVYDVSSTGVTIYENNWYGSNIVSLRTMSFLEFAQRQYESGVIGGARRRGALSLFRSDNYDVTASPSEGEMTQALTIYDARYPSGRLPKGSPYTLRGRIVSGTMITDVSAYIYDADGDVVYFYFKNPASTSYSIETGGLDDAFRFGTLAAGSYRYVVKAVDGVETKTLIDSAFYIDVPTSYTVRYDANGGSGAPASQTKTYNEALALSGTEPVRQGWIFLGWAESADAAAAKYQPGDAYDVNGSATLYALWEQESIVVPSAPVLVMDPDGTRAAVIGETRGLYARVALIVESGAQTGLYVTQVEIADNGSIAVPTLAIPGLTVSAISIVLVSRTEDISSSTPEAIAAIFKYL